MTKSPNLELRREWERRIAEYKTSGLSQVKYCEANGLSIHQFRYWMKRMRNKYTENTSNSWVPVVIEDSKPAECESLLVRVGSVSIEVNPGFNPSLLVEVIKVLKENVE